ncbi:hypothetical protein GIB67_030844 [Kingdonia uniflora]|uniref:Ubiquitin-activating enzyme SCCH domain-containing protein n=1 Tax=Kingdonia uniflora TaxID=39325 RepID=A0A7J7L369_9MAGN|nr:hypothetical protein GIB67_030844 [Kingdonia uniflora]
MIASILRAKTFGISTPDWAKSPRDLADVIERNEVPTIDFSTTTSMKVLISRLKESYATLPSDFRMKPIQFLQDDDTNYHLELVARLCNLRANTYNINPELILRNTNFNITLQEAKKVLRKFILEDMPIINNAYFKAPKGVRSTHLFTKTLTSCDLSDYLVLEGENVACLVYDLHQLGYRDNFNIHIYLSTESHNKMEVLLECSQGTLRIMWSNLFSHQKHPFKAGKTVWGWYFWSEENLNVFIFCGTRYMDPATLTSEYRYLELMINNLSTRGESAKHVKEEDITFASASERPRREHNRDASLEQCGLWRSFYSPKKFHLPVKQYLIYQEAVELSLTYKIWRGF